MELYTFAQSCPKASINFRSNTPTFDITERLLFGTNESTSSGEEKVLLIACKTM